MLAFDGVKSDAEKCFSLTNFRCQKLRGYILYITKKITIISILICIAGYVLQHNSYDDSTNSPNNEEANTAQGYIIKGKDLASVVADIEAVDGEITHELYIISAIAAELTKSQLDYIESRHALVVSPNHRVELASWKRSQRRWQPKAMVADLIGATAAHQQYNFGDNVTIGFLDTGLDQLAGLSRDLYGYDKAWGTYDALNNSVHNYDDEANGHGTHVASVANNSDFDMYGKIYGVAPNAAIVGIKAFDYEGKATYADVIRGIEWALQVKDQINLRVLNMSFSGSVRSYYWEDPLNQAVMKAWQAGIVVVASAGNKGPDPMTIGVPGNVPYIITVGAMTDSYSSATSDDLVATFSSAGPTAEGFVKPDIVAPGGHITGLMSFDSQIVMDHPEYHDGGRYFEMSGTSQAAAAVSGAVALMLTDNPYLSPDDVKCRLMDTAKSATEISGESAYSVFQQGAGVVNVSEAINSTRTGCANQTLNIDADLAGTEHFFGPSNISENGHFYVEGMGEDYVWEHDSSLLTKDALIWKVNYQGTTDSWRDNATTDALIWKVNFETDALIWKVNLESDALIWKVNVETDALIWKVNLDGDAGSGIAINHWVEQQ